MGGSCHCDNHPTPLTGSQGGRAVRVKPLGKDENRPVCVGFGVGPCGVPTWKVPIWRVCEHRSVHSEDVGWPRVASGLHLGVGLSLGRGDCRQPSLSTLLPRWHWRWTNLSSRSALLGSGVASRLWVMDTQENNRESKVRRDKVAPLATPLSALFQIHSLSAPTCLGPFFVALMG